MTNSNSNSNWMSTSNGSEDWDVKQGPPAAATQQKSIITKRRKRRRSIQYNDIECFQCYDFFFLATTTTIRNEPLYDSVSN
jgi:hypothetical protein